MAMLDTFKADSGDFDGPVLVTGAGGCIGAWALAILDKAGIPAVAFDLSDDTRRPALHLAPERLAAIPWLTGDIADTETVARVMADNGIRAILHLAALQVPFCIADPVAGAKVNVVGTVNVFEAARANDIKRVAYASSIAAHGILHEEYQATLYGAFKYCDENIGAVYWQDWGVPSTGIRPGVVYGVGRDQGLTSKTTVAILAAAAGRSYAVPFKGAVSFLHAGEIASAFIKAVSRPREGAPVFDCNGVAATVEESLDILRELAPGVNLGVSGDELPFPADLSNTPLRDYLGDYGSVPLDAGIKGTFAAFKDLLAAGQLSPDGIE